MSESTVYHYSMLLSYSL